MPKVSVNVDSGDERCRRYSDLRPDELEHMVKHLENDAKRCSMRRSVRTHGGKDL